MLKKITTLCLASALLLTGCGGGPKDSEGNTLINPEDIVWEIKDAVIDGDRRVVFNYTNNTDYTITELSLNFKLKSDSLEQAKQVFKKYVQEGDLEEERIPDLIMDGDYKAFAEPGETLSNERCTFGYRYASSMEEAELFEPDIMKINYIDENKVKTVYYDYANKTITEDDIEDAYQWEENELSSQVPKPDARVVEIGQNNNDTYSFDIFDMSKDDFKEYVEEIKSKGFTENVNSYDLDSNANYDADNTNGFSVDCNWDDYDNSITVYVRYVKGE